jgi:50S ribosomal protein L16 3-hydroxylase
MVDELLSARGARAFLARFWQKKPLLERAAVPDIGTMIDRAQLIDLACRDDVESRIVAGAGRHWEVRHGPFRRREFARLPRRNWTLLVHGVENFVPDARELQTRFEFVPYARHDDVMVSYAVPGGSVGPHYDSYDVFLIQGAGTRRWRISAQHDLALIEGAPLRLLRRFRPGREWRLASGDLLYLPPRIAHHGVALEESITWSIGLRAPGAQEFAVRFLEFLGDRLQLKGDYRDPAPEPQIHPARIAPVMLSRVRAMTAAIRWSDEDILCCLGEYLTEPRANIVYTRAAQLSAGQFARLARARGLKLALASRMLTAGGMVFINGESAQVERPARLMLQQLADQRRIPAQPRMSAAIRELLYQWYRAGYVEISSAADKRG